MVETMHPLEIENELKKIGLLVKVLLGVRTKDLLEMYNYSDSVGWILDPTGYRDNADTIRANKAVVEAVAALQKVIREHWPQLETAEI